MASKNEEFVNTDFEVFGKVQGVFFRKCTHKKACDLGLKGWVMNTAQGTVMGQIQGSKEAVDEMKNWLETVGSPASKVDKAIFKNEGVVSTCAFKSFTIRR